MHNINTLENKNVLITGASGGLGKSLCRKFGSCNTNIYAIGRNEEKLIKLSEEYKIKNYYCCNLFELEEITAVHKKVLKDSGGIDILINNAGLFLKSSLEEIDTELIRAIFNVNVFAPIILTKLFSRNMKEKKWGRIFNIGSSSAYNGGELTSLYCSSKHALLGFSRSMSKELHEHKIRVCNISPSSIKTNMGRIPLSTYQDFNTFLDPDEIAEVVVFLSSFDSTMEFKEIALNRFDIQ